MGLFKLLENDKIAIKNFFNIFYRKETFFDLKFNYLKRMAKLKK